MSIDVIAAVRMLDPWANLMVGQLPASSCEVQVWSLQHVIGKD